MRAALFCVFLFCLLPFYFCLISLVARALLALLLRRLDLARSCRGRRRGLLVRRDAGRDRFGLLGLLRSRLGGRRGQAAGRGGRERHVFELRRGDVGGRRLVAFVESLRRRGHQVVAFLGHLALALLVKLVYVFGDLRRRVEVLLRLVLQEVLHEVNPDRQTAR